MKVGNNPLMTGVQGFNSAKQKMQEAANNIASGEASNKDLTTSIVDLKQSELDAKANAKVIETAAQTTGYLLDIKV